MDEMTAQMCQYGKGRIGYARVLVEVSPGKEFKEYIEVQYKDNKGIIVRTKKIKVEYSWKPAKCSHCKVFGHSFTACKIRPKTVEELAKIHEESTKNKMLADKFVPARNFETKKQSYEGNKSTSEARRYDKDNEWKRQGKGNYRQEYRPKTKVNKHSHQEVKKPTMGAEVNNKGSKGEYVHEARRKSNMFAVLERMGENIGDEMDSVQKNEVEYFLNQRLQPTPLKTSKWSQTMIRYFKDRWGESSKQNENVDEEEVMEDIWQIGRSMGMNEIVGEDGFILPSV
ncbi:hypothetical protein Tco_1046982 [Tanacetum coccineum]